MKAGFITLVGRPNAGKSTLLNFLTGTELAAVSPKAQTTRTRVLGIINDPARGQMVVVDTPGRGQFVPSALSNLMTQEITESLHAVDATVLVIDPLKDDLNTVESLLEGIARGAKLVVWFNKSDLRADPILSFGRDRLMPFLQDFRDVTFLEGSAKAGTGLDQLKDLLWSHLPEHPPYFPVDDSISDRPVRYFVSEKIREQLFFELREELPYSAGVVVDQYEEGADTHRIDATIVVARETHKSMVIGRGGEKVKSIGIRARRSLEQFLGVHVYLNLRVKVNRDWTQDENQVRRIAYGGLH